MAPGSPLWSAAQQEAVTEQWDRFRPQFRLLAAIGAGLTLCAAGAAWLAIHDDYYDKLLAIAPILLLGWLICAGAALSLQKKRLDALSAAMRALPPDAPTLAQWANADAAYAEYHRKTHNLRVLLLVLGGLLGGFTLGVSLIAAIIYCAVSRANERRNGLRPGSPTEALRQAMDSHVRRVERVWCTTALFLFVAALFLQLYTAVANSKRQDINSYARNVYYAALQWQERRERAGEPRAMESFAFDTSTTPEPGSPAEYMLEYDSTLCNTGWIAVICGEDGEVHYTLYSRHRPLTTDSPLQTSLEQKDLYMTFRSDQVIGCYSAGTTG